MTAIQWNPALDTGIGSIDHEHRRLVELLNDVDRQVEAGAPAAAVTATLGDFHALASAHLALEEGILRAIGHPALPERRTRHHQLLDGVRDIMEAFEHGDFEPPAQLTTALKGWLGELIEMDGDMLSGLDQAKLERLGLERD